MGCEKMEIEPRRKGNILQLEGSPRSSYSSAGWEELSLNPQWAVHGESLA